MKILIADDMEPLVVHEIEKLGEVDLKPANLNQAIANTDVLIVRSATKVTKELLGNAKKLKIVARAGVGLDNVDQAACKEKGIKVLNTPGASTNAVAELVITLIMSSMRGVQKAHHQMINGKWEKKSLVGSEIEGKTLGIIGYGRIGSLIGKKASALGMKIIAYNPPPRHEDGIVKYFGSFDAFLARCDVISINTSLTNETKNMINSKSIAKMKNGVYIVNASRGEVIDEDALYEGCKSKKIAAAALDVYVSEPYKGKLLELDNVYFTPHIGASTKEAQMRIGEELVKLLKAELGK
ncbi:hydroxyacid dehydrogenase [Candidatus Micrarchaeota archaeon]|nr:hydroxyacid dehydrogenase [Candidatus Micrarchaeota archaeon]